MTMPKAFAGMKVIGADGVPVGTVEGVAGGRNQAHQGWQRRGLPQGPQPLDQRRPCRWRRGQHRPAVGERRGGVLLRGGGEV